MIPIDLGRKTTRKVQIEGGDRIEGRDKSIRA